MAQPAGRGVALDQRRTALGPIQGRTVGEHPVASDPMGALLDHQSLSYLNGRSATSTCAPPNSGHSPA
jgi:hypothetical protein